MHKSIFLLYPFIHTQYLNEIESIKQQFNKQEQIQSKQQLEALKNTKLVYSYFGMSIA